METFQTYFQTVFDFLCFIRECILKNNPLVPNEPFLYPLKTSENLMVFLMFSRGRERVHWERMS